MIFGTNLSILNNGQIEMWKNKMAGGEGNKKRYEYCTDPSGEESLYLRALQGHSGHHLIDPILQHNVLIPDNLFEYIYHIGCAISLHSISKFRIDSGRTKFKQGGRQTVIFTL